MNDLLKKILELKSKSFNQLDSHFIKGTKEEDISNFIYYHAIRNILITLFKSIDNIKEAKTRHENPLVAENLKAFLIPMESFIDTVNEIKENEYKRKRALSEKLKEFRTNAKKFGFLCSLEEEFKYENLSEKDYTELITSLKDLNEDLELDEKIDKELDEKCDKELQDLDTK